MSPIRTALAIAGACALAATGVDLATAQEVKQEARPAARPSLTPSNVTQDMLNRAIDSRFRNKMCLSERSDE